MPWFVIVLCSLLPFYWGYLLFNTQPVIIFDAIGYDASGRLILNQGLAAFFHGLQREPLFPYLISRAMGLGQMFGLQYHYFLKGILFLFLAGTLMGIYRLARLLGAGRGMAGMGALYAGVSPMIVNSALWLWSEAAALPWGVWGVFFAIKAWRSAMGGRCYRRVAFFALASAAMFAGLLLVKAAVSVVVVVYGLPFLVAGIVFCFRRDFYRAGAFVIAGLVLLGVFISAVEGYKTFNFRMNGNYALTDRFDWALYGNTARRLQPLTRDRVAQAVLSVPRLALCEKYYGQQPCVFWSFPMSDAISNQALAYCGSRGLSSEQQRTFLVEESFRMMMQHPFQQAALSALEGTKMLFWDNRVYFVRYPDWLARAYSNWALIYTLCFGWAVLSLASLVYAFLRRSAEFLLAASFVFWFMAVHSIFFIDIRYALPIAPLLIALTAGMFGRVFRGTFGCFSFNAEV